MNPSRNFIFSAVNTHPVMVKTSSLILRAACIALLLLSASPAGAANAKPPTQLTYQGFLTDANGVPFGNSTPVNKTVYFRIYDALTGGTLKWSAQQVVTVDKGYFSVLLGQGSAIGSEPFSADLTSVFTGSSTVSERYLELTADGTTIAPRLRYLPSPYALLAKTATELSDPNTGASALSIADGKLSVGSNVTLATAQITATSITASGALSAASITASGALSAASITATSISGYGTIPIGGIIMWSGAITAIPTGWKLCDGANATPDLRDRFIMGAGASYAVTATGGQTNVTLTAGNLPSFSVSRSTPTVGWFASTSNKDRQALGAPGTVDNNGNETITSSYTGSNTPIDIRPRFFALAFIMRTQ
ncbi:MAG: hypothetical protein RL514_4400 [Verrucomicrobiota bacterium]|jgi:microcystin-dependent protein